MDIIIENNIINKGNHFLNHNIHNLESRDINVYLHYWGGGPFVQNSAFVSKGSHYQVYFALKGEGIFTYDNRNYPIVNGDLFIIKPYAEYHLENKSDLSILSIAIEPYSLSDTKELINVF